MLYGRRFHMINIPTFATQKPTPLKNIYQKVLFAFIFIISFYRADAQFAADQNFNSNIGFSISSNNFVLNNVRYILTGPSTYSNEVTNYGALSSSGSDGAMMFDMMGMSTLSSVRIEMSNGSAFKLDGMHIDFIANANIRISPNGDAAKAVTYTSNNMYTNQLVDVSANTNFQNVNYISITGSNLTLDLDDLNFSAAVVVVPVNLTRYTATRDGKRNKLEWETAQEAGSSHFDIEHATDGINFKKIGNRQAAGSSSTPQQYSFYDEAPVAGKNYYRLTQIDVDGKSTSYEVKWLQVDVNNSTTTVGPNPATDQLTIRNAKAGSTYYIFNNVGELMQQGKIPQATATLNVKTLVTGSYLLVIGKEFSFRFIKK
ncbi:MAG: C-terminal target protein [Ferruginibacter sp.]|nr:C-terminal target protein [Ferruginibacter sp.]